MTAYRAHRNKALPIIVDFLDTNYPCDCPRTDPCGSNTAEAIEIVQTVLEAVAADIWETGYNEGRTAELLRGLGIIADSEQLSNPYRASEGK